MAYEGIVEEVDLPTAYAMWEAGDLIVDVRTRAEYAAGHIAGAVNVPLRELTARERELPAGQVVAVCSMGYRSLRGAHALARLGRTAFSLRGGTKAWAAAGHPVVRDLDPGSRRRPGAWQRLLGRLVR